jgi:hypothetical protein
VGEEEMEEEAVAGAAVEQIIEITTTTVTLEETDSLVPALSSAIVLLVVVSLALVLVVAYFATKALSAVGLKKKKRNITLVVGPSGAGKTTLLRQLQFGKVAGGSVTSVIPNEAECTLDGGEKGKGEEGKGVGGDKKKQKPLRVVDYPGHVKLRSGAAEYLDQATKVVFVTDSLVYNQSAKVRDAAG